VALAASLGLPKGQRRGPAWSRGRPSFQQSSPGEPVHSLLGSTMTKLLLQSLMPQLLLRLRQCPVGLLSSVL
jgi:hypothetical protein